MMLQIGEHAGIVDGDGSLSAQRVQKPQPLIIRGKRDAMEYLQYAFEYPFGDQRHAVI